MKKMGYATRRPLQTGRTYSYSRSSVTMVIDVGEMMRPKLIAVMAVAMLLTACSGEGGGTAGDPLVGQKPSFFVLTWPDYDGDSEKVDSATWVLDGQSLGKGDAGYKQLLERLKSFPIGSTLKVQFKPANATGGGRPYYVPLRVDDEYLHILKSRQIKEEYPPIGAGWG